MDADAKLIDELISDRSKFDEFVYTPVEVAIEEMKQRDDNVKLAEYISGVLGYSSKELLKADEYAVLSRPVVTPNYELRRFFTIADALKLKPVVWEYTESKFVPQNECKYALGRMGFFFGVGKKGGIKMEYVNVIDIDKSAGKKISEIQTRWGQSLVDFHHSLFEEYSKEALNVACLDGSGWYEKYGGKAGEYYFNFLVLFLMNGILFENFMLDDKEVGFTRDVFLPALIRLRREIGFKPLIVALEATTIEGDKFWMSYPGELISTVRDKLTDV